jgi:catechol 2,3-dioxygenase-like lactoylglutathione lyase family enzyme
MIAGAHTIIFAEDAERARAFLHDVPGFEGVDAGDGWLIFALPPGEIAVHPGSGWGRGPGQHALFFMCHDIERTVRELEGKGVEFVLPIEDGLGPDRSVQDPRRRRDRRVACRNCCR